MEVPLPDTVQTLFYASIESSAFVFFHSGTFRFYVIVMQEEEEWMEPSLATLSAFSREGKFLYKISNIHFSHQMESRELLTQVREIIDRIRETNPENGAVSFSEKCPMERSCYVYKDLKVYAEYREGVYTQYFPPFFPRIPPIETDKQWNWKEQKIRALEKQFEGWKWLNAPMGSDGCITLVSGKENFSLFSLLESHLSLFFLSVSITLYFLIVSSSSPFSVSL